MVERPWRLTVQDDNAKSSCFGKLIVYLIGHLTTVYEQGLRLHPPLFGPHRAPRPGLIALLKALLNASPHLKIVLLGTGSTPQQTGGQSN